MLLSAAMIVKDEAAELPGCLASLEPVADEICVVDTGSSDGSPEVAAQCGARVAAFAWNDDFSAARNAALRLCTGAWILVIDADERIAAQDAPVLRRHAAGPPRVCYRLMTRNYTDNAQVSEFHACPRGDPWAEGFAGWFPSWKVRLFPNRPEAAYTGVVHELVRPSLEALGLDVRDCPVPIHHYPLRKPAARIAHKQAHYLALGEKKAAERPDDPKAQQELGNQLADMGRYAEAAQAYRRALALAPDNALALKDLGTMLHLLGHHDQAVHALRLAADRDPAMDEAWRNLAVVHLRLDAASDALPCIERALALEPGWADGHRYRAIALEALDRLDEAAAAARRAVELAPEHDEARRLYLHQMQALGRADEARAFLEQDA